MLGDVSDADSGLTFGHETTVEFNKNLFFDPIPFEMLKTYETKPQVIISVGDLPAVCHNTTCGFDYVEPEGEITAFTHTGTKLTFTGTALPTDPEFYQRVMYAYSECTIDAATVTATGFECELVRAETCGSWKPIVTTIKGNIPLKDTIANTDITCSISATHPLT